MRRLAKWAATVFAAFFMAPAAASAAMAPPAATAVQRGPAMWLVQDHDTTIFLFGTFHALDERSSWFDRSVRAAFESAGELVLETLVPETPAELHAALARQALAGEPQVGQPVVGRRSAGPAQGFVASAGKAMSAGRTIGMSVDNGADAVLRRAASASGKEVEGLESFEFQLAMFAGLPSGPGGASKSATALPSLLGAMQSAWRSGDTSGFAAVLSDVRAHSPAAYRTLFVERNAQWARWIAERLERPGTVFVAVGTGHLIGPDSVQQQLAAQGIGSARIS